MNIVSSTRHKSWYVHLTVWVVPRQLFQYGDTWRYSTAAIESRGARLKRFGRKMASWRGRIETAKTYIFKKQSGETGKRTTSYNSSPMEQLLKLVCAQEDAWHTSGAFVRPEKIRLQQHARSCRLKMEPIAVDAVARPSFDENLARKASKH